MSAPIERSVDVAGGACRVWDAGVGEPIGFLAGFGGLPRWTPFLERLSQGRRVIVPSFPGFPGGRGDPRILDDLVDWVATTLDLLEACDLVGADLIGASVGGTLLAETAALCPSAVQRLVLVGPFGLQNEGDPTADPFARKPREVPALLSSRPALYTERFSAPENEDPAEWYITMSRAHETTARLLWPTGNRGLAKRLHRIRAETLIVWGEQDRLIPGSYAKRFADGITGSCEIRSVEGAGHLVDLDAPEALADAIDAFLGDSAA